MQRPTGFKEAIQNTILARALKKASQMMAMDQDEIGRWRRLPRSVRSKMSGDDVAEWRRQNKSDQP